MKGPTQRPQDFHQGLFGSLRGLAKRTRTALASGLSRLTGATRKLDALQGFEQFSTHPAYVKRLLPSSCFTKRGPGVSANVRAALKRMTPAQRAVCRARGWI